MPPRIIPWLSRLLRTSHLRLLADQASLSHAYHMGEARRAHRSWMDELQAQLWHEREAGRALQRLQQLQSLAGSSAHQALPARPTPIGRDTTERGLDVSDDQDSALTFATETSLEPPQPTAPIWLQRAKSRNSLEGFVDSSVWMAGTCVALLSAIAIGCTKAAP